MSLWCSKIKVNALSTKDLRNLFKLRTDTPSDTHDKLKCERCKIIADDAEADAMKVLPKKLAACRTLLERMMEEEDSEKFLTPLQPEEEGVSREEYDKYVKQPMDLGTIKHKLDSNAYKSVSDFSKDVNRIFTNVLKVWTPGQEIADISRRLQSWWLNEWTALVPVLMNMKPDLDDCENPGVNESHDTEICSFVDNERGNDFQEQIGMPDEENMRNWSHHHSTDTVDDPVFRAAMRGYDAVSFVFGLEVTWSLIQERQQAEEERAAMEELERIQKLEEEAEAAGALVDTDDETESTAEENITAPNGEKDELASSEVDNYFSNSDDSENPSDDEMPEHSPDIDAPQDCPTTRAATSLTPNEDEWNCTKCSYINGMDTRKCEMCGFRRKASPSSGRKKRRTINED